MIDFSDKSPRYKSIEPLKHPRYYCYAVVLPDKNILVLGGKIGTKGMDSMNSEKIMNDEKKSSSAFRLKSQEAEVPQNPLAVREPELFNPEDGKWYPMAPMQVDRLYHANALLLPDGRVMTAGSNPDRRINELRIELYDPPYLFRGERPKISKYPSEISYGRAFEIETPDANNIKEVVLLRPSVTTHCVNTEQRLVSLEFNQKNLSTLLANVPSNKNLLPPGYYMLFIIHHENIPSVAPFVLLLGG